MLGVAVLVHKAFRFRVYPNTAQVARLRQWDGALRFLWNIANRQRLYGYARPRGERVFPTAFDQMRELTELRASLPWLADVPRNVCEQLLVELDKAWQRCFSRLARAPRWKLKGRDALSFCEPHPKMWRLDSAILRFPKLGNLHAVVHRSLEGAPKTCTLTRDGTQWFVSIVCIIEITAPTPRAEPVLALDRGVVNMLADSDGGLTVAPRFYEIALARLARAQRSVSRKRKGSKNQDKAKVRVAALHRKVRRQREHFLHGLSYAIAKRAGVVVIEKLNVSGMTASASGTSDAPGRNVKQKTGLSRGILDAGWSCFAEMLRYKLTWSGGSLAEVPAAYSSQTCSACRCVDARSRVSQSVFRCTTCGYEDHADLNAAKVLKQRYKAPGNPWCLLGEGIAPEAPQRTKKRLRVPKKRAFEGRAL